MRRCPRASQVTEIPKATPSCSRSEAGAEAVGFDFAATCEQKQLVFALNGPDGAPVDPAEVHVGTGEVTALPVVAQRHQPAAPADTAID